MSAGPAARPEMRVLVRRARARLRSGLLQSVDLLRPRGKPGEIVAICHCHHAELVPELARTLSKLPSTATLHLSSSRTTVFERWTRSAIPARLSKPPSTRSKTGAATSARSSRSPARCLSEPETLVLKIHGKKSSYSAQGEDWRRDLLAGLLPRFGRRPAGWRFGSGDDPRLGLLGAPRSFLSHPVYWGLNRENINRIMAEICGATPADGDLGFFAGSMFWMRGALLLDLLPHIDLEAFEPEPLPQDGSYAHAIERVIPMAAHKMGWGMGEIDSETNLDRDAVRERKIAYL